MEMPRSGLRRPSRARWVVLALLVLAAGAGIWSWLRQRAAAPASRTAETASAPTPGPAAPSGPAPAADPARVRSLFESLSSNALFRRWLGEGDHLRRWAVVTDNLAEGVSPRAQLGFLAPSRPFSVLTRDGRTVIDPASYQRYDEFADAVASVDVQALARAYRELHPVLESVYRALGYPNASLDAVTARALQRIVSAPARDGDVEAMGQRGFFVFADPRLEELRPVEKHLLRMGPRNTRLVQAKARDIAGALGLPPPLTAGSGAVR
jgi:hypothetical protein